MDIGHLVQIAIPIIIIFFLEKFGSKDLQRNNSIPEKDSKIRETNKQYKAMPWIYDSLPRHAVMSKSNNSCAHCGRKSYRSKVSFHVHHVIPRSKGGSDEIENLIFLCEICHSKLPGHQIVRYNRKAKLELKKEVRTRGDRIIEYPEGRWKIRRGSSS